MTRLLSLQKCLLAPAPEGCGFLTRLMDAYDETTPDAVEVKELDTPAVENQVPPLRSSPLHPCVLMLAAGAGSLLAHSHI